ALQSLGEAETTGSTNSESLTPAPAGRDDNPDETMERAPVAAGDGAWSISGLISPPPPAQDDWPLTEVSDAEDVRVIEVDDVEDEMLIEEGTPIEGTALASAPLSMNDSSFVAGEIDVPTPSPALERGNDSSGTGTAGGMFPPETSDPDTGPRTPPLERR